MKPICIFDFSKSQIEHINYGIIEDIKNGCCSEENTKENIKLC